MNKIYIIASENIYYLEDDVVISVEGYFGYVREGYVKHPTFVKPIYIAETFTFEETATP